MHGRSNAAMIGLDNANNSGDTKEWNYIYLCVEEQGCGGVGGEMDVLRLPRLLDDGGPEQVRHDVVIFNGRSLWRWSTAADNSRGGRTLERRPCGEKAALIADSCCLKKLLHAQ